ncbi:response regulator [Salinibacter altiplanensis]|uniref:response regulator n=1 Tax=Salinibacter altiplanensis TaxID=1803181 RepID=UPI001F3FF20F|nr:response regulator [Salinibacter altiplanensis]
MSDSPSEFPSPSGEGERPIRILLVEDNPADVRLTREMLRESKVRNDLLVAYTAEEAEGILGLPEERPPENGLPQEGSPQEGSPADGAEEEGTKEGAPKEGESKKGESKEGKPEEEEPEEEEPEEEETGPRPDLVLLDLNLPVKSGHDLLEEIKSHPTLRRIPVVMLSSSEAEEDVVKSYDEHANAYVTKPVDLGEITTIVQSIDEFWFQVVRLPGEQS